MPFFLCRKTSKVTVLTPDASSIFTPPPPQDKKRKSRFRRKKRKPKEARTEPRERHVLSSIAARFRTMIALITVGCRNVFTPCYGNTCQQEDQYGEDFSKSEPGTSSSNQVFDTLELDDDKAARTQSFPERMKSTEKAKDYLVTAVDTAAGLSKERTAKEQQGQGESDSPTFSKIGMKKLNMTGNNIYDKTIREQSDDLDKAEKLSQILQAPEQRNEAEHESRKQNFNRRYRKTNREPSDDIDEAKDPLAREERNAAELGSPNKLYEEKTEQTEQFALPQCNGHSAKSIPKTSCLSYDQNRCLKKSSCSLVKKEDCQFGVDGETATTTKCSSPNDCKLSGQEEQQTERLDEDGHTSFEIMPNCRAISAAEDENNHLRTASKDDNQDAENDKKFHQDITLPNIEKGSTQEHDKIKDEVTDFVFESIELTLANNLRRKEKKEKSGHEQKSDLSNEACGLGKKRTFGKEHEWNFSNGELMEHNRGKFRSDLESCLRDRGQATGEQKGKSYLSNGGRMACLKKSSCIVVKKEDCQFGVDGQTATKPKCSSTNDNKPLSETEQQRERIDEDGHSSVGLVQDCVAKKVKFFEEKMKKLSMDLSERRKDKKQQGQNEGDSIDISETRLRKLKNFATSNGRCRKTIREESDETEENKRVLRKLLSRETCNESEIGSPKKEGNEKNNEQAARFIIQGCNECKVKLHPISLSSNNNQENCPNESFRKPSDHGDYQSGVFKPRSSYAKRLSPTECKLSEQTESRGEQLDDEGSPESDEKLPDCPNREKEEMASQKQESNLLNGGWKEESTKLFHQEQEFDLSNSRQEEGKKERFGQEQKSDPSNDGCERENERAFGQEQEWNFSNGELMEHNRENFRSEQEPCLRARGRFEGNQESFNQKRKSDLSNIGLMEVNRVFTQKQESDLSGDILEEDKVDNAVEEQEADIFNSDSEDESKEKCNEEDEPDLSIDGSEEEMEEQFSEEVESNLSDNSWSEETEDECNEGKESDRLTGISEEQMKEPSTEEEESAYSECSWGEESNDEDESEYSDESWEEENREDLESDLSSDLAEDMDGIFEEEDLTTCLLKQITNRGSRDGVDNYKSEAGIVNTKYLLYGIIDYAVDMSERKKKDKIIQAGDANSKKRVSFNSVNQVREFEKFSKDLDENIVVEESSTSTPVFHFSEDYDDLDSAVFSKLGCLRTIRSIAYLHSKNDSECNAESVQNMKETGIGERTQETVATNEENEKRHEGML